MSANIVLLDLDVHTHLVLLGFNVHTNTVLSSLNVHIHSVLSGPNCHGPDGSVVQDGEEMQVGSKTCKCDTSSGLPLIACNFTD